MRRESKHQTVASMKFEAIQETYDFMPNDRVITCDGIAGRVVAVHEGPFRGNEEYEVELDHNLGGGRYVTGQLQRQSDTQVQSKYITADIDYPELAEVLQSRPDPARMEYTASKKEDPFSGVVRTAFIQAAVDQDFRFQFTSAWKDVVSKAKKIRSTGGVHITHAADGVIYGNVQGDTAVYETGIERLPNSRTGVSNWSCGCKWGAYHWGADDDLSRFAGRQCSHSLALQYEAQSRGMFGKTVHEDAEKPSWVPSRVVVKHDIDSGKNIKAHSGLDLAPISLLYSLASTRSPGLAEDLYSIASVYDPFGDSPTPQTDVNPNVPGATKPHDPLDNPGSSGYATGADPSNWGSIQENNTFSTYSVWDGSPADSTETTDSISGTETAGQPLGETTIFTNREYDPHVVVSSKDEDEGAEAELKDEPEGALPEATATNYAYSDPESLSPDNMGGAPPSGTDLGIIPTHPPKPGVDPGHDSQTHEDEIDDVMRTLHSKASQGMSKEALRDFSFQEQQELINEGKGSRARNFDRLNIEGTHYAFLSSKEEEDPTWLI